MIKITGDDDRPSLERVRRDVAEVLQEKPSDISDDENLMDRGMDSIRLMTVAERWRAAGADVSFLDLAESPTVSDWWELLHRSSTFR